MINLVSYKNYYYDNSNKNKFSQTVLDNTDRYYKHEGKTNKPMQTNMTT